MKKAIHASLFHVASSKETCWQQRCPDGIDSWCVYRSDRITGENTYRPGTGIPLNIIAHIKPIYKDRSNDRLLEKCLHRFTQNQNESFNGPIWNRLPKSTYVGSFQLQLRLYDAVVYFNCRNMTMISGEDKGLACRAKHDHTLLSLIFFL